MIVKVCGFTEPKDARAAVRIGIDWLGLNFWPGSKRAVDIDRGAEIASAARAEAAAGGHQLKIVGVFVNQDDDMIRSAVMRAQLDMVQLHGDHDRPHGNSHASALRALLAAESRRSVGLIQVLPLRGDAVLARLADIEADYLLLDTPTTGYGGSGQVGDWELARTVVEHAPIPVLLAGGLTPTNVGTAVAQVSPSGIDVASGVESAPGRKDESLMRALVEAAGAAPH